jgi:hypothetical protein
MDMAISFLMKVCDIHLISVNYFQFHLCHEWVIFPSAVFDNSFRTSFLLNDKISICNYACGNLFIITSTMNIQEEYCVLQRAHSTTLQAKEGCADYRSESSRIKKHKLCSIWRGLPTKYTNTKRTWGEWRLRKRGNLTCTNTRWSSSADRLEHRLLVMASTAAAREEPPPSSSRPLTKTYLFRRARTEGRSGDAVGFVGGNDGVAKAVVEVPDPP